MAKTSLSSMVWPEVQEALERKAVVMIPLASVEPSGRHSYMGGEQVIVEAFCEGVAARTGAIWLPTMPFGYAPNFMGFPGTISLQPCTLADVIYDVCKSVIHHGFDHLMIVDNHTGNEATVEMVAQRIRDETGVILGNIWLPPVMRAVANDLYPDLAAVHGHGGEPGCSVRLYLRPDEMRMDLAVKTEIRPVQGLKVSGRNVKVGSSTWQVFVRFDETSPSGGTGYPFDASEEKGRIVVERMIDWGVQALESFQGFNTR